MRTTLYKSSTIVVNSCQIQVNGQTTQGITATVLIPRSDNAGPAVHFLPPQKSEHAAKDRARDFIDSEEDRVHSKQTQGDDPNDFPHMYSRQDNMPLKYTCCELNKTESGGSRSVEQIAIRKVIGESPMPSDIDKLYLCTSKRSVSAYCFLYVFVKYLKDLQNKGIARFAELEQAQTLLNEIEQEIGHTQ